jgi:flagellar assembly factor FliW
MQITTSRFGVMDIDPDTIITFTQPIIGFQEFRRFILLPGPKDSGVSWLQSTESEDLAFLLMDPRSVIGDYAVPMGAHELAELAASTVEELEVYTLVVVPADHTKIRTNLKAPIVINQKIHLGKQTVLEKSDYPIQYFLAQDAHGRREPRRENYHARTDT